ncbi:adenylate kinase, chloroplastic-like isoform X2 [Solanum dulcamara]|uniref:adenylate kinase, chloroplastic-like isoform X2 n=1 Tax=Solanum dulcamara TaxID=45834 RepID=UPI002485A49F|nr:adenylate kinase, chloroplastic-like isoform X2 [Solanum dulcamara]
MASCCSLSFPTVSSKGNKPSSSPISSYLQLPFTSHLPFSKKKSLYSNHTLLQPQCRKTPSPDGPSFLYDLVHIAAGDLLRAEIAAGTENGRRAKEYMDKGQLVPNEIVVTMVKERLMCPDSQEKGWLLDGYPRSLSQAVALKEFQPDLFILLEVPEDILVERVVGRRLDPVTGRIYHLKYSPPETDEIAARLTQRFDDTEEKVKLRLHTHHQNVESVLSIYKDFIFQVDGSVSKEEVFTQIDGALTQLLEAKEDLEP